MRTGLGLLLLILLLTSPVPISLSLDYTPTSLAVTLYIDGVVGIEYKGDVNPTAVRVTIPLLSSRFPDLLVVNQNGLPLVTSQSGSSVTVDTLGASKLTITYSTQELTSKVGTLWTLNVTSPTNLVVMLPSGVTIIDMSQIPLDVSTVGGRTQVTMPPGVDSISYVVSAVGTKEHAQSIILDAEATVTATKAKGVVTTAADGLLTQAKTSLNSGDYLKAEQLATQAKSSALEADLLAQAANTAIQRAASAIQTAKNEGRTSNSATADALLRDAQTYYSAGDYTKAKTSADQAYDAAVASKGVADNILIAAGVVALIALAGGVILYTRRGKKASSPKPQAKKGDEAPVDLDAVFQKNHDLRVDDKEVLRFLAERGGEAFANEIRERFGIPRTSAWRMIRRLMDTGIVEERKIGGQSLIYIVKKYRRAQEG